MINQFLHRILHLVLSFSEHPLKSLSLAFVFCFSVLCGFQVIFLSAGNLINNYPFMGPDSYDWYVEGIYLVELFGDEPLPNLFVLRPPVFVLVCALDYLLWGSGYVVGTLLGLCIFGTYALCLALVERAQKVAATNTVIQDSLSVIMGRVKQHPEGWSAPILAIALTLAPINFFTPFVYADRLASFLSLLSIYLLICWHEKKLGWIPMLATIIAVIAGLTQIYAAIPFAIAITMISLNRIRSLDGRHYFQALTGPVLSIAIVGCLIIGASLAWRFSIPHSITPTNFGLIRFDFEMLRFYKHTWGFYILPIALIVILLGRPTVALLRASYVLQIALGVSITMMGLLLLYHWEEARFTYYFFPWLMIFLCAFFSARNSLSVGIIVIFLLVYSALVPQNYWIPQPRTLELNLRQSWIGDFALAQSVDRGLDKCEANCLANNLFIASSEGYTQRMMGIYLQLMEIQRKQEK
jgi:hypothetical protein